MKLETADQFRSLSDFDRIKLGIEADKARRLAEADVAEAQRVSAAKSRIARGAAKLEDYQLVQADVERQLDDDADSRA